MSWTWSLGGSICLLGLFTLAANAQSPPSDAPSPLRDAWFSSSWVGSSHWWTRYGEPVNAAQLAAQPAGVSARAGASVISLYGPGYVYRPGSCDCPPPCIGDLWTGYVQNPKRCHPGCGWLHRRCGGCCPEGAAGCMADCSAGCGSFCLGQRIRDVLSHCHACEAACGGGPACGCTVAAPAP